MIHKADSQVSCEAIVSEATCQDREERRQDSVKTEESIHGCSHDVWNRPFCSVLTHCEFTHSLNARQQLVTPSDFIAGQINPRRTCSSRQGSTRAAQSMRASSTDERGADKQHCRAIVTIASSFASLRSPKSGVLIFKGKVSEFPSQLTRS